jgi:hypothetical protein
LQAGKKALGRRVASRFQGIKMNANLRNFALWVIIVLLLLALFTLFQNPGQHATSQDISYSQFVSEVDQNRVRDVLICAGRYDTCVAPAEQRRFGSGTAAD